MPATMSVSSVIFTATGSAIFLEMLTTYPAIKNIGMLSIINLKNKFFRLSFRMPCAVLVCFRGKFVNIGVDVHKRSWRITALVEETVVLAVTLSKPNYGHR